MNTDTQLATVSISFGRNINGVPMPLSNWHCFRDAVAELVPNKYGIFKSDTSNWQGEHEESALVLGTIARGDLVRTRLALASLAALYSQDAIGLIVQGDTETLVFPG
jgi:hypothetical protein